MEIDFEIYLFVHSFSLSLKIPMLDNKIHVYKTMNFESKVSKNIDKKYYENLMMNAKNLLKFFIMDDIATSTTSID